jgi:hypothetical protein
MKGQEMPQTIEPGTRVTILANDCKVAPGSHGRVAGRHPETGNLLVDVDGRGRVAFASDQVQPEASNGSEPARTSPMAGKQHSEETKDKMREAAQRRRAGVSRELYLNRYDTAEELGVSVAVLDQITKHAGIHPCGKQGCRYTLALIGKVRALQTVMEELDLPAAAAAKVQAYIARKLGEQ